MIYAYQWLLAFVLAVSVGSAAAAQGKTDSYSHDNPMVAANTTAQQDAAKASSDKDKMYNEKKSSDQTSSDKMSNDKTSNDKMSNDKTASEKMSNDRTASSEAPGSNATRHATRHHARQSRNSAMARREAASPEEKTYRSALRQCVKERDDSQRDSCIDSAIELHQANG